jgi:hypothetical protein
LRDCLPPHENNKQNGGSGKRKAVPRRIAKQAFEFQKMSAIIFENQPRPF